MKGGRVSFVATDALFEVEATAADSGADRLFFTLEKRDDTNVYDEWSYSSSENGLWLVKVVTSSTILALRDGRCPFDMAVRRSV